MNNLSTSIIVIGITLGVIAVVNISIILYFKTNPKIKTGHYKSIGKLLTDLRRPWKNEEEKIEKLSSMVKSIQNDDEP